MHVAKTRCKAGSSPPPGRQGGACRAVCVHVHVYMQDETHTCVGGLGPLHKWNHAYLWLVCDSFFIFNTMSWGAFELALTARPCFIFYLYFDFSVLWMMFCVTIFTSADEELKASLPPFLIIFCYHQVPMPKTLHSLSCVSLSPGAEISGGLCSLTVGRGDT